ncbi:MAG: hypothetical protein KGL53_11325, partial [Elusimicrobia bacterium]|nr:hypothetical protein [Elusimicrobiota bacterium]
MNELMTRRRRTLFRSAAALAVWALLAAVPARAQQVFINGLWVENPAGTSGRCDDTAVPGQLNCDDGAGHRPLTPQTGSISNDPHIEFDNTIAANCSGAVFPPGDLANNVCNNRAILCASIGYDNTQSGNSPFALDYISFEVFKFQQGSNPLDSQSTPPLRTFFVDSPGSIPAGSAGSLTPPVCVIWDGSINMQGEFGKSNGQYGFRATVATNQTGASGNINITQTRAFPGGFTSDSNGNLVDEKPITVDVTDVHVVQASPTVVGSITGVAAEPYNLTYRLSKDSTMYLTISQVHNDLTTSIVRTVVPGLPRVGEGTPSGTLQNGDSWNGRYDNGDLAPPGVYLATLQAYSVDQYGGDLSIPTTRQLALDTLQITDIRVQPLTDLSTSLAVLSYELTEPATVYIDIYPPGTQFTKGLESVNTLNDISPASSPLGTAGVQKDFGPSLGGATAAPVRHIEEQKDFRKSVISFWDGRDSKGNVLPDGDYVFVLYAALPSQNGTAFNGNTGDKRVWSTNARSGFLSISRGFVTISQVGPASTVIGSSPPVAGLDPFNFSYSLSREADVSLKVYDSSGAKLIKTLVNNEVRPGNFLNKETWQTATGDDGQWISSGAYLIQLTAADTFFPAKVSTTTALFLVNPYRITDLHTSPLLTGATDVLTMSYQLSQPMNVAWNIYPPGTTITG